MEGVEEEAVEGVTGGTKIGGDTPLWASARGGSPIDIKGGGGLRPMMSSISISHNPALRIVARMAT